MSNVNGWLSLGGGGGLGFPFGHFGRFERSSLQTKFILRFQVSLTLKLSFLLFAYGLKPHSELSNFCFSLKV